MAELRLLSSAVAETRLNMRLAMLSDKGLERPDNQDTHGFVCLPSGTLFVVADGMGGARGGATASAIAVNLIAQLAPQEGEINIESLRIAVERANRKIFSKSRADESLAGMGTTVVALALTPNQAIVAHVGDSRIYLCQQGALLRLTRDHTLVQELIESGAISNEEASNHPIAHMLSRSLGPAGAVDVDIRELAHPPKEGDLFLLCCDGLYNMVKEEEIQEIIVGNDPDVAVDKLMALALERGGTDNITIELIQIASPTAEGFAETQTQAIEVHGATKLDVDDELLRDEFIEDTSASLSSFATDLFGDDEAAEGANAATDSSAKDALSGIIFKKRPSIKDVFASTQKSSQVPPTEEKQEEESSQSKEEMPLGGMPEIGVSSEEESATAYSPEYLRQVERRSLISLLAGITVIVIVLLVLARQFFIASGGSKGSDIASLPAVSLPSLAVAPPAPAPTAAVHDPEAITAQAVEDLSKLKIEELQKEVEEGAATSIPSSTAPANENVTPLEKPLAVDVLPGDEMPELAEEGAKSIPPESTASGDPAVDIQLAVALASNLHVPTHPPISGSTKADNPDQPIIWEHEKQLQEQIALNQPREEEKGFGRSVTMLLSDSEQKSYIEQKQRIRQQIAEIDERLQLFAVRSREQVSAKVLSYEKGIELNKRALSDIISKWEEARKRKQLWERQQSLVGTNQAIKATEQVALVRPEVREKKAAYEDISARYLQVVEDWRKGRLADKATTEMASLGRELDLIKAELYTQTAKSVDQELSKAKEEFSRLAVQREDLERRILFLNRQYGFTRAFIPLEDAERVRRQRDLFDERSALLKQLEDLRKKLSDADELHYRHQRALADPLASFVISSSTGPRGQVPS